MKQTRHNKQSWLRIDEAYFPQQKDLNVLETIQLGGIVMIKLAINRRSQECQLKLGVRMKP